MAENKVLKLLIVEDDPGISSMLSAFFTSHGADDYGTKPFSPKELWMRIQAVLNFLDNVIKLMENTDRFTLCTSDQGSGIPEEL